MINILLTALTLATGGKPDASLLEASALPDLPVHLYLCESCRGDASSGFLQNILSPLSVGGIRVFRQKLSLPVIISAVVFGLIPDPAHHRLQAACLSPG